MKTLEQVLAKLQKKKKTMVKVGSENGMSFFYCGKITVDGVCEIENFGTNYLAQCKRELKNKKAIYSTFDEYWDNRIKKIELIKDKAYQKRLLDNVGGYKDKEKRKQLIKAKKKYIQAKLNELPKVLEKAYKERDRMKKVLPKRIAFLEKEIKNYVPLLSRSVVSVVDSISPDEPNTKIIYIKGNEIGKYWTVKEYIKAHLPKAKRRLFDERLPRLIQ